MMTRRTRRWTNPAIDRLEARRTPSQAGIVGGMSPPTDFPLFSRPQLSTTPADGSSIEAADSPSALILHMGAPAGLFWFDHGVELREVAADGSEAAVVKQDGWGWPIIAGDTVTLALPTKLDAGRYRIVLLGGSGLAFTYSQDRWDATRDHSVAEFDVKPAAAAIDLGRIGPSLTTVSGSLDDSTAAADSFQIHLAEGTALWRLALQVDAGRIGSGLVSGLAVHDAEGRQVASVSAGSGLPTDFPDDPYLFAGLAPGDYTVVVSKEAGTTGGAYRLNLTATRVAAPTRVSSFDLDRPEAGPSAFTIAFSSAIDPMRLRSDAVSVVDAAGAIHAVKLESVNEGLTTARFVLLDPLPAGSYRLVVGNDRPLADLIGRSPVAEGLPAGTLASWTVSADEAGKGASPRPGDLLASGALDLGPGEALEIPITLGDGESLVLSMHPLSGATRVEVIGGPDGAVVLTDGTDVGSRDLWVRPGAGSFVIRIVSAGDRPLAGSWSLAKATTPEASLVARAVGSRGAIGLALGEGADSSQPSPPSSTTVETPRRSLASTGIGPLAKTAARSESGPSPWAYGAGSTPVGRPTATGDAVAPVGPATPGGTSSLAWDGNVASAAGSSLVLSARRDADDGAPNGPAGTPEDAEAAPTRDERIARAAVDVDADGDDDALARAERVAAAILGRLEWMLERPTAADVPASDLDAVALAEAADPSASGSDGKVQRSALDLPFTVLFVTAATFQLRRATRRWWNRRKLAPEAAGDNRSATSRPLLRGPRFMAPVAGRPRIAGPRRG
jgi:hypothetical protein